MDSYPSRGRGSAAGANGWVLHTPALSSTRGWCSVTNLSFHTRMVAIKMLDENGAAPLVGATACVQAR